MIELGDKPEWKFTWGTIPFAAVHLGCLGAFWVPFSWWLVALAFGLYLVKMFALTAGFHRYLSHRSFKTSRAFQLLLVGTAMLNLQRGPLWWAAHHRRHHRHSDREGDLHSPTVQGFLWAHLGWILAGKNDETDFERIADFARYPELRWLDRWHHVPGVALAVALFLLGGWPALVWGFCVSTVMTWHATFSINTLTHMIGRRRYATPDGSRNSLVLALVTLGEGWHNNHHYYKSSTRQGFFWWEIDLTYYALRALALFGLVWDLKEPPAAVVAANRIARRPAPAAEPEGQTA
jgi:stearoyl-CoA desaturase (delta-9 desaturase)